jgi:hypothetical protein
MPTTYNTFDRYGTITPTLNGNLWYGTCKYDLSPAIYGPTTNTIYKHDATADYSTFSTTGVTGFYDAQAGLYGVGAARYMINGSNPSPNIKFPTSSAYNTGVSSYKTASLKIFSEHALQTRLDIVMDGNTDSTSLTLTPNVWNSISVSSNTSGASYTATLNLLNVNTTNDTGKIFYVDQVQVENLRYATAFQNQEARLGGQLSYTIPKTGPDYTALIWTKIGPQCSTQAQDYHPFFTLYNTSTDYLTLNYQEGATKIQAFKDDTDPNTDIQISSVNYAPGDVVFGAIVNDGLTVTVYVAKDGDASLLTASAGTEFHTFETVYLGQDPASSRWANSTVEQFLLYNKALTQAEVLNIFQSATPLDYTSSDRIIFAAATPSTKASYNGLGVAGTGYYRNNNETVSLDIVSATSSNTTYGPTGSSSHMFYGNDVNKLKLGEIIATSTNISTANLYRVESISFIDNIGRVAYASKL